MLPNFVTSDNFWKYMIVNRSKYIDQLVRSKGNAKRVNEKKYEGVSEVVQSTADMPSFAFVNTENKNRKFLSLSVFISNFVVN